MATIPRAALDFVTDEINGISADAQRKAMRVLERIDWSDVTAARELAVEAAQLALSDATTLAAQASADFYDASRELAVGEKLGARTLSGYNPDATDGAIRGFVRFVERGDIEQFNDQVMQRIDYEIKRAAGYSMTENGAADPLNPRYARVPTGTETCAFCLMLASRGFVYRSERNAGSMNHYHSGCDCRIVCSWQTTGAGVSRRASLDLDVEGYDPDALYDEWIASIDAEARERAERNGTSFEEERASIMRAYRRSADGAKRRGKYAASGSGMEFESFADVKRYVYGATSQADLEHRYGVLSGIYGARSEQMRSQSMRNAFSHMEKRLGGATAQVAKRNATSHAIKYDGNFGGATKKARAEYASSDLAPSREFARRTGVSIDEDGDFSAMSRSRHSAVYTGIEHACSSIGYDPSNIRLVSASQRLSGAYAEARKRENGITIHVDAAKLAGLSEDEIEQVLFHEVAHGVEYGMTTWRQFEREAERLRRFQSGEAAKLPASTASRELEKCLVDAGIDAHYSAFDGIIMLSGEDKEDAMSISDYAYAGADRGTQDSELIAESFRYVANNGFGENRIADAIVGRFGHRNDDHRR